MTTPVRESVNTLTHVKHTFIVAQTTANNIMLAHLTEAEQSVVKKAA